MKKVNNNIELERARFGWTKETLAQIMNVEVHDIERWEKGEGRISSTDALRMSDLFGCSIDYLFRRSTKRR